MIRAKLAMVSLVLMASACDGGTPLTDGGAHDASDRDGGTTPDGMVADAGCACASDQSCIRGVCVHTCGADIAEWDTALAGELVPVANFCRSAAARAVVANATSAQVYDLTQTAEGSTTVLTVSRWPLTEVGGTVTAAAVATQRVEPVVEWGDATPFASGYLAVSPSGGEVLFGYTVFVGADPPNVPGEVFRASTSSGEVTALDAPGNFDAAWINDTDFVVSGLGLGVLAEGNGLYVSTTSAGVGWLASGLGLYSGSLGITPDYLIAGGTAADFSSLVFTVPRATIDGALGGSGPALDMAAAGTPVTSPDGAPFPSSFRLLPDGALSAAEFMGPVRTWSAEYGGGELVLTDETTLSTEVFSGVHRVDGARMLLEHPVGVLLVAPR